MEIIVSHLSSAMYAGRVSMEIIVSHLSSAMYAGRVSMEKSHPPVNLCRHGTTFLDAYLNTITYTD